jgi:hypothetical protein
MPRGSPDWQPWTAVQRFSETGGAVPFEQMFTVPANTAEASPASSDIPLTKGFVSRVWIRFPQGPAALLHVAIFDGTTKLWPGGTGQWFSGDNEIIQFDTEYDVPNVGGSYKLTIKGWNEDDAYEHSALVRIWVVKLP